MPIRISLRYAGKAASINPAHLNEERRIQMQNAPVPLTALLFSQHICREFREDFKLRQDIMDHSIFTLGYGRLLPWGPGHRWYLGNSQGRGEISIAGAAHGFPVDFASFQGQNYAVTSWARSSSYPVSIGGQANAPSDGSEDPKVKVRKPGREGALSRCSPLRMSSSAYPRSRCSDRQ